MNTIEDLVRLNPSDVHTNVFVADPDRGGLFSKAVRTTTNNGTMFMSTNASWQWNRQYSGAVNVKWFGAVGDGVTDDTAAIQAAIDAAADSVYVPEGAYKVSTTLLLTSNTTMTGAGLNTIIKLADGSSVDLIQNSDATLGNTNIHIMDMTLDMNGSLTSGSIRAIRLENTDDFSVESVNIKNTRLGGITVREGSDNGVIRNCWIDGYATGTSGQAIAVFRNCFDILIEDNRIENPQTSGAVGILVDDASSGNTNSLPCVNVKILSNVLLAPYEGIDIEGCNQIQISGNSITNALTDGIIVQTGNVTDSISQFVQITDNFVYGPSGTGGGISVSGRDILVEHNIINGVSGAGRGILLKGEGAAVSSARIAIHKNWITQPTAGGTGSAIRIAPAICDGLIVSENFIEGSSEDGVNTSGGGTDWSFLNNTIVTPQQSCIEISVSGTNALTGLTVKGNLMVGAGQAAAATHDGVNVAGGGAITGAVITGNWARGDGNMRYGVVSSGGTGFQITDNLITGYATGQYSDSTTAKALVNFGIGVTAKEAAFHVGNSGAVESILERASSNTGAPGYYFRKARGDLDSKTIVENGDVLGRIRWYAWDGSDYNGYSAEIRVESAGTPGSNVLPGRMYFATTAAAGNTPTDRGNIDQNGVFNWTGSVNIGGGSLNASAIIQTDSTTKGFLPPRMTEAQKNAIATPANGLLIYQTDGSAGLYAYIAGAWVALTSSSSASLTPVGTVITFAGSSAPTGYLICDGAAVSRATYATLFGVIGETYGVGDGSTTFNLPDGRGRTVVGVGTGAGLTARALAATGGEETHVLTEAELPSLTGGTPLFHNWANTGMSNVDGEHRVLVDTDAEGGATFPYSGVEDFPLLAAGSDDPHNVMQPFIAMNMCIKF